jgi:hypothetical protein
VAVWLSSADAATGGGAACGGSGWISELGFGERGLGLGLVAGEGGVEAAGRWKWKGGQQRHSQEKVAGRVWARL